MMSLKKLLCLSLVSISCCALLAGCGNDKTGSTSGNNDNNVVSDATDDIGNAAEDLAEGAGNAIDEAADGIGNAVDDLVGTNGFDNYDDAYDYFLKTMESYHADAKFEIRDEDRELDDYHEGSKGYAFELYDTSKNEKGEFFGEFYVDADTGVIYQELEDDRIVEYHGSTDNTSANSTRNRSTEHNVSSDSKNSTQTNTGSNPVDSSIENSGTTTGSDTGAGTSGGTTGGAATSGTGM